jgi:hypothetical protein
VENFFSANRKRMLEPHYRFELYCLAGDEAARFVRDRLRCLDDQALLDLQVWFYLSWTGVAARSRFPVFSELILKGKNFNAAESLLQSIFYGVDRSFCYFRIVWVQSLGKIFQPDDSLSLYRDPRQGSPTRYAVLRH